MSEFGAGILGEGRLVAQFLVKSAEKFKQGLVQAPDYAIASLERAINFLDKISDYNVLDALSVDQLNELSSVVTSIRQGAVEVLMYASMAIDPSDPEAMEKLEKIQELSFEVIEKSVQAQAMIVITIMAKQMGEHAEDVAEKFGPFNPSPIVHKDIVESARKDIANGDFGKP